jgi:hypothetical protein
MPTDTTEFLQLQQYIRLIVICEMSARTSGLFEAERRRSECFICANVLNTFSSIEVWTIFFETNIMSDLSCTLCE